MDSRRTHPSTTTKSSDRHGGEFNLETKNLVEDLGEIQLKSEDMQNPPSNSRGTSPECQYQVSLEHSELITEVMSPCSARRLKIQTDSLSSGQRYGIKLTSSIGPILNKKYNVDKLNS